MALGFAFAGVTLALLALLVAPLLRRTSRPAREDFDLRIYRDQLDELERDLARGVIGEAEARAARLEVERRILAAASRRERDLGSALAERRVGLAAFLLVAVPTFAGALYFILGQPGLPGRPLSARVETGTPATAAADIDLLVEQLRARLAEAPGDARGWQLLGRTELTRGRADAAVEALRRAAELAPDDAATAEQLGEALVIAAQGAVTPAARARFEQALAARPGLPRARFYLGLVRAQAGDLTAALDDWLDLLRQGPPDAAWRPNVEAAVRDVAFQLGRDADALLAGLPQPAGPGPSAEDTARMQALPPEQQAAAIRGMVDGLAARLEANPDDVQGWLRLGRARAVLGEPEPARAALDRALALAPEDREVLATVAMARLGPIDAVTQAPQVGADAAALLTRWAAADPGAAEPHWYLGLYHLQAGRRDQAIAAWQAALARLPEWHPERPALKARLAELGA